MLPRDTLGVNPVLRPGPATPIVALGDPRQQAFQRALASQVGNALPAQVLARLADGSAVVRVADMPARMMLPVGAEVGTEVPLKLVSLVPRPTFEYGAGAAATLVEASPLPPGARQPAAAPGADEAAEPAATFIPHEEGEGLVYRPDGKSPGVTPFAGRPGEAAPDGATGAKGTNGTNGSAPAAGSAAARAAAASLASHARPMPQSAPADPGASLSATGRALGSVMAALMKLDQPAKTIAARVPVLGRPSADAETLAPALRQAIEKSGLFYESHVAQWAQGQRPLADLAAEPQAATRPATPTDPEAAQLINLQLASHEQHQLAWEGQLWPGQPMRWEISRDAPQQQGGQEADEPVWQSRLVLRFPKLGELRATVMLNGDKVALRLEPGADDVAGLLRLHAPELAAALDAAGTPLAALSIAAAAGQSGDE
jgi:hypothetical protein